MDQFERAPIRMVTLSAILAVAEDDAAARDIGITLNRIYFLLLDGVRKALTPADWKAKQPVIHAATVACLRHASKPEDVCVQINDEQYILVFDEDDVEVIAGRCKRIADALEQRLFGEKGLGRIVIRDAARVFAEGSIHRHPVEEDAALPEGSLLQAEPEPGALRGRFGSVFSAVARDARRTNLLEILDDPGDEAVVYGYQPVWHTREGRIATYICQPRSGAGPNPELGYAALGEQPDASAFYQFDTHGIEECLFALKQIHDNGSAVNLMTSVHFETLANRATRTQLHAFLAAIPKRFGRLLTLHLAEVPSGIPDSRLQEITANLTAWVRGLAVSVRISECPTLHVLGSRCGQLYRSRVGIVNVDFEGHVSDESLQRAKTLATRLAPRGLVFAATNVPTAAALCELSVGDYAFLGGNAVGAVEPRPAAPQPFTMRDLERTDPRRLVATYL